MPRENPAYSREIRLLRSFTMRTRTTSPRRTKQKGRIVISSKPHHSTTFCMYGVLCFSVFFHVPRYFSFSRSIQKKKKEKVVIVIYYYPTDFIYSQTLRRWENKNREKIKKKKRLVGFQSQVLIISREERLRLFILRNG